MMKKNDDLGDYDEERKFETAYQNGDDEEDDDEDNYSYDNNEYTYRNINNNFGSYKYFLVHKKHRQNIKIGAISGVVSITKSPRQGFPLIFDVGAMKVGGKRGGNVDKKNRNKGRRLQCTAEAQVLKTRNVDRYYIWDEVSRKASVLMKSNELVYRFNVTRINSIVDGGYGGEMKELNTSGDGGKCIKLLMVASFDNHYKDNYDNKIEVCLKMVTYFNLIGSNIKCATKNLKFFDQLEGRVFSIIVILAFNISFKKKNFKNCSELSSSSLHFSSSSFSSLSSPFSPLEHPFPNSTIDCVNEKLCNSKYNINMALITHNLTKSSARNTMKTSINNKHFDWSNGDKHTHHYNSHNGGVGDGYDRGEDGGSGRVGDGGDVGGRDGGWDKSQDSSGSSSFTLVLLSLFLLTIVANISAIKILRSFNNKVDKNNTNEI